MCSEVEFGSLSLPENKNGAEETTTTTSVYSIAGFVNVVRGGRLRVSEPLSKQKGGRRDGQRSE